MGSIVEAIGEDFGGCRVDAELSWVMVVEGFGFPDVAVPLDFRDGEVARFFERFGDDAGGEGVEGEFLSGGVGMFAEEYESSWVEVEFDDFVFAKAFDFPDAIIEGGFEDGVEAVFFSGCKDL